MMKKRIFGLISIFLFFSIFLRLNLRVKAAPLKEGNSDWEGQYVINEVLVKFKFDKKPFRRVQVPQGKTVKEMVSFYRENPQVEYAEPNYFVHAFMIPNDPHYHYQWHFDNDVYGGINLEKAWEVSTGSKVVVAVLDTGIAYENYGRNYQRASDLAETCFVSGYDFVNHDSHPNDDEGHGTHIAGTIAQSTNNNLGAAGVAFKSCLMPVKVLDSRGSGTYADVSEGIQWAADQGAQVINLSLGGDQPSATLENALAYAYNKGVTLVAASGNDSRGEVSYPAGYDDYVIAVGATQYDETRAPYSNYGASLDLVAPGGNLKTDQNNDGYGDGILQQTFRKRFWQTDWGYYFMQGTSCAAPHVTGAAALVIANGVTGPDAVRNVLETTAEDLGPVGWDKEYGWGLVNPVVALGVTFEPRPTATPTSTPTPTATPTLTPTPTPTPVPELPPPDRETEIKVTLEEVAAQDARVYRNYQVKAELKNNGDSDVAITTQLEINDPGGNPVNWSGMGDKEVNLTAGESKAVTWSGRIPWRADRGSYTAIVSLFYQENLLVQGSDGFLVSSWGW